MSDELFKRFIDEQIDELEARDSGGAEPRSGDSRRVVKELEKAKKRLDGEAQGSAPTGSARTTR